MKKVSPNPALAKVGTALPDTVAVVEHLKLRTKTNFDVLRDHAIRINGSLPADGSEPLTGPLGLAPYTVAQVAALDPSGRALIFVSDEAGGPVPAFSDGLVWRRVTDRAVVS